MKNLRKTVRVLLLNKNNELLLMRVESADLCAVNGKPHKSFWCTIGGAIDGNETVQEAALREIYEETGLTADAVSLGPVVWCGAIDLVFKGKLSHCHETFIVARTQQSTVSLHALTDEEKGVVKELRWFSLEDIQKANEPIFPTTLAQHLPDVIAGKTFEQPINIVL